MSSRCGLSHISEQHMQGGKGVQPCDESSRVRPSQMRGIYIQTKHTWTSSWARAWASLCKGQEGFVNGKLCTGRPYMRTVPCYAFYWGDIFSAMRRTRGLVCAYTYTRILHVDRAPSLKLAAGMRGAWCMGARIQSCHIYTRSAFNAGTVDWTGKLRESFWEWIQITRTRIQHVSPHSPHVSSHSHSRSWRAQLTRRPMLPHISAFACSTCRLVSPLTYAILAYYVKLCIVVDTLRMFSMRFHRCMHVWWVILRIFMCDI
jgi:hypothetical protein